MIFLSISCVLKSEAPLWSVATQTLCWSKTRLYAERRLRFATALRAACATRYRVI